MLRFARGTDGQSTRASRQLPVSAATEGSNARFWWLTSFTLRDDHVESTSRRTAARYASSRRLALFFGAPHLFLWARPKKWGGKGFYKGLPLFCPAALRAALCIQAQLGAALCHRTPAGLHTQCGRLIYTYLHAQAALARLARLAAVFEPAVPADGDNIAGMHLRRAAAGGQGVDEHELALKKPLRLRPG